MKINLYNDVRQLSRYDLSTFRFKIDISVENKGYSFRIIWSQNPKKGRGHDLTFIAKVFIYYSDRITFHNYKKLR
jgi:hypothetical protein